MLIFLIRAFSKLKMLKVVFLSEAFNCIIRPESVFKSLFCTFSFFVLSVEPACIAGSMKALQYNANDEVLYMEFCVFVQSM